ncbi:MAG: GGDEF domain-containing protein [Spirochaetales bacterium]|nr:GGDEF domain-containing protein [Spirochaetales bacterium]
MKKNNDIKNKLFELLNNESFTSKFISGIAGDRIQNDKEKELFEKLLLETGGDLYVKLLFYITHQIFDIEKAKMLWDEIINHKEYLSKTLKRNVEITVAALDYLTNIKDEIKNPKLIGEAFIGKIAEITSVDPLTKLFNRHYLYVKMDEEIKRFKRYNTTFSILFIDIDNFKHVNDTYGHQQGDEVLKKLSSIINNSLRDLDICARYGGEEFIIILPHTDINLAKEIAERIRSGVENYFSGNIKITISIGLSNCPTSATTKKNLIKQADNALYISKNKGKNRVTIK